MAYEESEKIDVPGLVGLASVTHFANLLLIAQTLLTDFIKQT